MKNYIFKSIAILSLGVLMLSSCSDYLLETPEIEIGLYVLNEEGELVKPDTIVAGKTELYVSNEATAFFSVFYSGEKVVTREEVGEDGNTYTIFKVNRDFADIDNPYYVGKDGRRAVKGSPLEYVSQHGKYMYGPYVYYVSGNYDIYIQATNTCESGETEQVASSINITVVEGK